MADVINFFAYGELMNEEYFKQQKLEYIAKSSVTLSAWEVAFNKIPTEEGAPEGLGMPNIEPTPSSAGMMFGVMYEVDASFLPRLDEIHEAPKQYQRKVMRFTRHDFNQVNGLVYVARPENTRSGLKPSKATMKIIRGAKKAMPMLYFSRLMNTRTCD